MDCVKYAISLHGCGLYSPHPFPTLPYRMTRRKWVGKVLPWMYIAISNAKRSILDTYHDITAEYSNLPQQVLYKFNRKYFGFYLFERLELNSCSCKG